MSLIGLKKQLDLQDLNISTEKALKTCQKVSQLDVPLELINRERPQNKTMKLTDEQRELGTVSGNNFIPSGVWLTGAPTVWKQRITGKTCLVGVLDTGIDRDHPDLKGKVIIHRDFTDSQGTDMSQWHPHGTHVAGTIAANGRLKGVAPDAKLADYRVLNEQGVGSSMNIAQAIYQATLDGCNIINLSLGGPVDFRPLHAAVRNAVQNGVLVVAAVGNSGDANPATDEISYPAYYPEVCGAGAVKVITSGNIAKTVEAAFFTNSNKEVDVAAPGFRVLSTIPGGGYAEYSGTSMASPHVSGFAALLYDKAKMCTQKDVPETVLYAMTKSHTVDIDEVGIDVITGAGFTTLYPTLPKKKEGKWVLEEMNQGKPNITTTSSDASV